MLLPPRSPCISSSLPPGTKVADVHCCACLAFLWVLGSELRPLCLYILVTHWAISIEAYLLRLVSTSWGTSPFLCVPFLLSMSPSLPEQFSTVGPEEPAPIFLVGSPTNWLISCSLFSFSFNDDRLWLSPETSYQHLYSFQIRRVGISPDHKEYIYFKVQWREHTEIKVCLMRASVAFRNSSFVLMLVALHSSHISTSMALALGHRITWELSVQRRGKWKIHILSLAMNISFWRIVVLGLVGRLAVVCFPESV